jgi:hypothetical protein
MGAFHYPLYPCLAFCHQDICHVEIQVRGSCTYRLRIIDRDFSQSVLVVCISRSSAFASSFQASFSPRCLLTGALDPFSSTIIIVPRPFYSAWGCGQGGTRKSNTSRSVQT